MEYDIEVIRGTDYCVQLSLTESDGSATNLSGYSVSGCAKASYGASGILIDLAPTILNATGGLMQIAIPGTGSLGLPIIFGRYTVNRYTSGQASILSVLNGDFEVNPD